MLRDHAEARWIAPSDLGRFDFAPADIPSLTSSPRRTPMTDRV